MTTDLAGPPSPQADILTQLIDDALESGMLASAGSVTDGTAATVTIGDDLTGEFVITCTPKVRQAVKVKISSK